MVPPAECSQRRSPRRSLSFVIDGRLPDAETGGRSFGPQAATNTPISFLRSSSSSNNSHNMLRRRDLLPIQRKLHVVALTDAFNSPFRIRYANRERGYLVWFSNGTPILGDTEASILMNASDPAMYACKKREHIYFMKTHKCASSSVQNVLFRYGDKHNLTFVLPPGGTNYFGHPKYFNRAMLPTTVRPVNYSIFALHTRFHRGEVRKVMPPDTVYITILRDPVALFASMFSYYDMKRMYKLSLVNLVRQHPEPLDPIYRERKFSKFGLNQMAFDLGLPPSQFRNADIVDRFIKRLEETFDLVLIAERMPESLVLLRYLLCWDVDDVILFKKNARSTSFKKNEQQLTQQDVETLKRLNEADQKIYDYFNKILTDKLALFGLDRVADEKAAVEEKTKFWYNECVDEVKTVDREAAKRKKIYSNQVMYFEERKGADPECKRFLREELAYAAFLRDRQKSLYSNASSLTRQ